MLFRSLSGAGCRVHEAADGREAIRFLRNTPVDVLIIDLVMPESEGIETIQAIRREGFRGRIIVASGAHLASLQASFLLGADAVLPKPFTPGQLVTIALCAGQPDKCCSANCGAIACSAINRPCP